jgi:phage gp29-like protein
MPAQTQSKAKKQQKAAIPPAIARAVINKEQTPKRADFWGAYLDKYVLGSTDPILKGKGKGNLEFYEPVRQDDQVEAGLSQLISQIISREVMVLPGGDQPIDLQAAEDLKQQLSNIPFDDRCGKMAAGKFWGFSVAEAMYELAGDRVVLKDLLVRSRKRFLWTYENEIRWRDNRNYNGGELLPNKYWTFSIGGDSVDDPNGRGLAYWLYWPTFFKRQGMRWWVLFLEKYAKPHRHGTYPLGSQEDDIEALEKALEAFGEDDWTSSPEGTEIKLIEAARAGGSDYQGMVDICNAAISKIINGQTMTTDNGSSRSQAEVHQDIGLAFAKQLSDVMCQTFNESIARYLTEWNFPGAAIPKVWRNFENKDIKAEADTDVVLSGLGIKLKADAIAQKYGDNYEIPGADDALTQLNGEQVNALVSIVSNAQQGSWKPELVFGMIKGAFPSWPEKSIEAITKNLGAEGGGTEPGQPAGEPAPPLDETAAQAALDNAKFAAPTDDDPLLPIAQMLLEKLESAEFQSAEFRGQPAKKTQATEDPLLPIAEMLLAKLENLPTSEFARIPNGTKKSFNGQEYELKNSRWHRVDNGDLLENNLEKADRNQTEAEDKITRSEDRQARRDLMDSLTKAKPYTLKMVDGGQEITKAGNTLDLGNMKITRLPQTIKITPDGSGHRIDIGAGGSAVLSGGVTTNYDSPAESYQVSHSPIKISSGSSQLQIHDFLYHPDRGVLKKSGGRFAQFGKSVIKKPATKKKNCKPTSISCGFTCISGKKVCRITMTLEQQKAYKALKKELRAAKKVAKPEPTTQKRNPALTAAIKALDETTKECDFREKILDSEQKNCSDLLAQKFKASDKDYSKISDRHAKAKERYEEAAEKHKQARANAEKAAEAVYSALKKISIAEALALVEAADLYFSQQVTKYKYKAMSDLNIKNRKKAIAEFVTMTGYMPPTVKDIFAVKDRAFADREQGIVATRDKDANQVLWHEMAHHVEYNDPTMHEAAKSWRDSKATSLQPQTLRSLTGIEEYGIKEVAVPDSYLDPYVGKVYKQNSTEVISMGLENLSDPKLLANFRAKAPDHFDFILEKVLNV